MHHESALVDPRQGPRRRPPAGRFAGGVQLDLRRSAQVLPALPEQVQLDNARELAGWGPAARTLSRVIRLCLRFGVSPVFIPVGEPQFNGGVANFNGWFQPRLVQRRFRRPGDLRRELSRGWLTAYLNGRVLKRWPYKLRND